MQTDEEKLTALGRELVDMHWRLKQTDDHIILRYEWSRSHT